MTKPARRTIFISAYRAVSVRYILYSDIFRRLKEEGDLRMVLFVKDDVADHYRDTLESENVAVEPIRYGEAMENLRAGYAAQVFTLVKKQMSGSAPGYENTTDEVLRRFLEKQYSRTFGARSLFRFARAIAALGNASGAARRAIIKAESRFFPGGFYDDYFEKYKPEALIVSSVGYMIDPLFMRAAKRNGCKVISIVHSWDNTTTKGYRGGDPDLVVAWNDIMKRELEVFHDIPEKKIYVGGVAHWDFYFNGSRRGRAKEEFLKDFGLSPARKIIFYGTSSNVNFNKTFDIVEDVLRRVKEGRLGSETQLLVRLHPSYLLPKKDGSQVVDTYRERMDDIKSEFGDRIVFNLPMMRKVGGDIDMPVEDMNDLADMLRHSDLLLTEYSTLVIEAAIFDLPIINVGLYIKFRDLEARDATFENFAHIKRMLAVGAARNAYTHDQLYKYMEEYLADRSIDRDKRKKLVEQEITANPGTAGARIAERILECVKGNGS